MNEMKFSWILGVTFYRIDSDWIWSENLNVYVNGIDGYLQITYFKICVERSSRPSNWKWAKIYKYRMNWFDLNSCFIWNYPFGCQHAHFECTALWWRLVYYVGLAEEAQPSSVSRVRICYPERQPSARPIRQAVHLLPHHFAVRLVVQVLRQFLKKKIGSNRVNQT